MTVVPLASKLAEGHRRQGTASELAKASRGPALRERHDTHPLPRYPLDLPGANTVCEDASTPGSIKIPTIMDGVMPV